MKFLKLIYKKFFIGKEKKTYTCCRRCGKQLKSKESRKLGLGKCCYKKELYKNKLF